MYTPINPTSIYRETEFAGGIPIFLIFDTKHSVTYSRAKPQQTMSVEKHAHPPRVVYCAIYLTLTDLL